MVPAWADNTLTARGKGLFFNEDARLPATPRALVTSSADDDLTVFACLLCLKEDLSWSPSLDALERILKTSEDGDTLDSASLLYGLAAPRPRIRDLVEHLLSSVTASGPQSSAAARSPALLSALSTIVMHGMLLEPCERLAELAVMDGTPMLITGVLLRLSAVLEEQEGLISEGPEPLGTELSLEEYATATPESSFLAQLSARVSDLRSAYPLASTPISQGAPFGLSRLIDLMSSRMRAGQDLFRLNYERMVFEAQTGVDCSGFFDSAWRLRPLHALSILEEYQMRTGPSSEAESRRLFFGQPVDPA